MSSVSSHLQRIRPFFLGSHRMMTGLQCSLIESAVCRRPFATPQAQQNRLRCLRVQSKSAAPELGDVTRQSHRNLLLGVLLHIIDNTYPFCFWHAKAEKQCSLQSHRLRTFHERRKEVLSAAALLVVQACSPWKAVAAPKPPQVGSCVECIGSVVSPTNPSFDRDIKPCGF